MYIMRNIRIFYSKKNYKLDDFTFSLEEHFANQQSDQIKI